MLNILVKFKNIIFKNEKLAFALTYIHNVFIGLNKFRINANVNIFNHQKSLLRKSNITIIGENNIIELGKFSYFENLTINIHGCNNLIKIGDFCYAKNLNITIEDIGNKIIIGNKTTIHGETQLSAIEGTCIEVGEDCMFSSNIDIRTGDSHSISNMDGIRINPSKSIQIGNHVWIGSKSILLKGTFINENSIIGAASIITKQFFESNVIIAGQPGKIIKKEVNWNRERN